MARYDDLSLGGRVGHSNRVLLISSNTLMSFSAAQLLRGQGISVRESSHFDLEQCRTYAITSVVICLSQPSLMAEALILEAAEQGALVQVCSDDPLTQRFFEGIALVRAEPKDFVALYEIARPLSAEQAAVA